MTPQGTSGGAATSGAPAGQGAAAMLAARDRWAEAVWSSTLPPMQRLVALAYADHARDGLGCVWVVGARLLERTGISRDAAYRALRGLEAAGWLVVVERASQHRSTRYALVLPEVGQQSASRTPQQSASRTAEVASVPGDVLLEEPSSTSPRASSTSPRTSSTGGVHDYPSYYPSHHPRATTADGDPSGVDPFASGEEEGSAPVVVKAAARPDAPGEVRPRVVAQAATTAPDPRRAEVRRAALTAGVAEDVVDDVVDLALADTTSRNPAGRLATVPGYGPGLVQQVRLRRRAVDEVAHRELRRAGALRCEHDVEDGLALTTRGEPRCLDCRRAATHRAPRALVAVQ